MMQADKSKNDMYLNVFKANDEVLKEMSLKMYKDKKLLKFAFVGKKELNGQFGRKMNVGT